MAGRGRSTMDSVGDGRNTVAREEVKCPLSTFSGALIIVLVAAVPAAIAFGVFRGAPEVALAFADVSPIGAEELAMLPGDQILWIDARAHRRYAVRHIEGAMWLSTNRVQRALDLGTAWQPGRVPVVYGDGADWRDTREAGALVWEGLPGHPAVRVLNDRWDRLPAATGGGEMERP